MRDARQIFKALADDTRLRILLLLGKKNNLCVCEMEAALRIPQYRISRHLGILKAAGLLQSHREGPFVIYCVPSSVRRDPFAGRLLRLLQAHRSLSTDGARDAEQLRLLQRLQREVAAPPQARRSSQPLAPSRPRSARLLLLSTS